MNSLKHTIAVLIGLALVWYGLGRIPKAQESWIEPYVYDLAKEVYASECTVRGCNLTPALQRATAACEAELVGTTGNRPYSGCTFLIPAGDHRITETISACRGHQYIGRGGRPRRPATSIAVPDIDGIHARGYGDCAASGFGATSAGRILVKGLGLVYPNTPKTSPVIGIKAEAQVTIEQVWITYPTIGIEISAGSDRSPPSNANSSRLINVSTEYTRHAGVRIKGYDSNAIASIAPDINTGCMAKATDEGLANDALFGPCGSYMDHSFLGGFAVAGHFTGASGYPDVSIQGGSNRGVCLGCYQEGDTPGLLDTQNMWIGGKSVEPLGTGFWMSGSTANRLIVQNSMDPANVVDIRLGRASNVAGTYYGLHQSTNNWPLRMKFNKTLNSGSYVEDVANSSLGRVRSIRATRDGTPPPGGDSDALGRTKHWDVEAILQP